MTLPYDATSLVRRDGAQIIDAAERAGLDMDVPSCPGWTMSDLLWHMSEVWTFWRFVVNQPVTSQAQFADFPEIERVADEVLVDWTTAALTGLHAALTSTPPATEVWTWTGSNQDAWWVRRRMAQETAVHRWDAERVVGDPYTIWSLVASDGIDEFLHFFATRNRTEPLAGTVHLHCTDTSPEENGEWIVHRLEPGSIDVERAHVKGDAAIRGTANDLLLWLWGREAPSVDIVGDESIALALRDGSDVS